MPKQKKIKGLVDVGVVEVPGFLCDLDLDLAKIA